MDENVFWLRLWSVVLTAFTLIMLGLVFSNIREDALIADMVKNGVDPIAARCAYTSSTDNTMCVTYLIGRK
jgi:hypothetical protein